MSTQVGADHSAAENPFGIPPRIQLMNEAGEVSQHEIFSSYLEDVDGEVLKKLFRQMMVTRRVDDEATSLQRQGEMALWASCRGQEAAQVGSGFAYAPNDYIFPSYREHALAHTRGVDFGELLQVFRGSATLGWDAKKHNFHAYTLVLAAQVPHAVGYAMGLNFDADIEEQTGVPQTGQGQGTDPSKDGARPAVAVYFGDGSSTEGEVHESMVFAASYNAPVLFFVQNNQWAISVPFSTQSRVPVSTRAAGYGFEGLRVDGNDVLAVIAATRYALEKIRAGEGPVLIEAETYRLNAHTTADDPSRYQAPEMLEAAQAKDPVVRLEKYLRQQGLADDDFFESVKAEAEQTARQTRASLLASEPRDLDELMGAVYAEPHLQVEADRAFFREYMDGFED